MFNKFLAVLLDEPTLAGPVVRQTPASMLEDRRNRAMIDYKCKYTNERLEKKVREVINDPTKYDKVWERIEQYDKEHDGDWGRLDRNSGIVFYPEYPLGTHDHDKTFSTIDVGYKRLPFKRHICTPFPNGYEYVASLLMWTYGKETSYSATTNTISLYTKIK